jgi:hypothetical protein
MVQGLFSAWRRAVRNIAQLQLWEVLRRRGTRNLADANAQALGFAVERCASCAVSRECDRVLADGPDTIPLESFCPNTMYLRHLDAMQRHAPKRDLLGPES